MIKNFRPTSFKCLDISTAHITHEDAVYLENCGKRRDQHHGIDEPIVYEYLEGMLVYTGSDEQPRFPLISRECLEILQWAWTHKYRFVNFDCDGTRYDDLPVFAW